MRHFVAAFLLVFSLVLPSLSYAQVDIATAASNAILIDAETGAVLMEKKSTERMPTSSMSKVMTVYAVFSALEDGRLSLNDTMKVSEKAWRKGGSKMFVEVGKEVKVEDLIKGVIVQSGNDATIVLAEGLTGSEDVFAQTITQMAKSIGMKNSQFKNASGWPDPEHYSTAQDLSVLAYRLIKDFPQHYHYYGQKEFTYNDITQPNRNPLLYRNMGVDGIKTGHTEVGGYGLMASGERDDRRLILVVNGLDSEKQRADESARLLEWGFNSFENVQLFKEGEKVATADVVMGQEDTVDLVIKDNVFATLYEQEKDKLNVTVQYDGPLVAPVAKDTKVGSVIVKAPHMPEQSYDLYAGGSVAELGLVPKVMAKTKFLLLGKF